MKKISDGTLKTQIIQENSYHDIVIQNNVKKPIEGPNVRPPMPLPFSHNDWSTIKEGFSYKYNSKIPIDLKDVQDEAGFNLAKAKFEVAALQLQNIESLKLLKEKQGIESRLMQ